MISLESTNNMFNNCPELININLEFLKETSKWKYAISMFEGCIGLTEINFPHVNANLLKNTSSMFKGCTNLKNINLEELNAKNIENMESMFYDCINLAYLNINNLDTNNEPICTDIFKGVTKNIKIIYDRIITGHSLQIEINNLSPE